MFTGIVQGVATVEATESRPGLTTFVIGFPGVRWAVSPLAPP